MVSRMCCGICIPPVSAVARFLIIAYQSRGGLFKVGLYAALAIALLSLAGQINTYFVKIPQKLLLIYVKCRLSHYKYYSFTNLGFEPPHPPSVFGHGKVSGGAQTYHPKSHSVALQQPHTPLLGQRHARLGEERTHGAAPLHAEG